MNKRTKYILTSLAIVAVILAIVIAVLIIVDRKKRSFKDYNTDVIETFVTDDGITIPVYGSDEMSMAVDIMKDNKWKGTINKVYTSSADDNPEFVIENNLDHYFVISEESNIHYIYFLNGEIHIIE